jgi:hypothetical protein
MIGSLGRKIKPSVEFYGDDTEECEHLNAFRHK